MTNFPSRLSLILSLFTLSFFLALAIPSLLDSSKSLASFAPNSSIAKMVKIPDKLATSQADFGQAIDKMEKQWEAEYETYFNGNLSDTKLASLDIAKKLEEIAQKTGKRTAVIWVVSLPDELHLMAIMPGKPPIGSTVIEANRQILAETVLKFRQEITNPRKLQTTTYLPPAKQLYNWIVAPLEQDFKAAKIDSIAFCLGGGLRTLPIAALHDGKNFIIEKYAVARIPAFNMIPTTYTDIRKSAVLAMGASEFREQNPLPAVPLELSVIVNSENSSNSKNKEKLTEKPPSNLTQKPQQSRGLWPGKSFLNQGFTLDNLQAERRKNPYGIIHLATHAEFKAGKPNNSFIQFWNNQLTLDKMRDLKWSDPPVELLTLSACKTAVGDKESELGFAGLAVQSGVKAALASLWYVSDSGTLALMSEFYQQLRNIPYKAEALRQAQLGMIAGKVRVESGELRGSRGGVELPPELANLGSDNLAHPYYWAAFTIIGNPW